MGEGRISAKEMGREGRGVEWIGEEERSLTQPVSMEGLKHVFFSMCTLNFSKQSQVKSYFVIHMFSIMFT